MVSLFTPLTVVLGAPSVRADVALLLVPMTTSFASVNKGALVLRRGVREVDQVGGEAGVSESLGCLLAGGEGTRRIGGVAFAQDTDP